MTNAYKKILVALDVETLEEALRLVSLLKELVGGFKVGMELCNHAGTQQVVDAISKAGGEVFLDLKFKDIPNTVKGAARAACRPGVLMFNVHVDGGSEMMKAAADAAKAVGDKRPKVIGVSVLTSINKHILNDELRVPGEVSEHVLHLAKLAQKAGLDGLVCSPHEVKQIKSELGSKFLTVVPGVRPAWAAAGDQKRVMTPKEALEQGADYLVIGRPITQPPAEVASPVDAAKRIGDEIAGVALMH